MRGLYLHGVVCFEGFGWVGKVVVCRDCICLMLFVIRISGVELRL